MISYCLYVPSSTLVRKLNVPDVYVGMLVAAEPIERQEISHARALAARPMKAIIQCTAHPWYSRIFCTIPLSIPSFSSSILHSDAWLETYSLTQSPYGFRNPRASALALGG